MNLCYDVHSSVSSLSGMDCLLVGCVSVSSS